MTRPSAERLRELHRALLTPRLMEEKMLALVRQGRLSKWFSGIGQEAIAVGVAATLEHDDWILPLHRNLGVFTTRGVDRRRLLAQLLGRAEGFTHGRDRTFHFGSAPDRIVGMISHLGAMLPVACGFALAAVLRGERRVAAAFSGEGGTSEGDFHEAVNLAAVWKLPVIFVVENNGWALSTPVREQYACRRLSDRAPGYGLAGATVNGNDLLAVCAAVEEAAARARCGLGPTLLEFETFRMRGHEEASGTDYVPRELFAEWARKDPVALFEDAVVRAGAMTKPECEAVREELRTRIEHDVDEALALPAPDPASQPIDTGVWSGSASQPPLAEPAAERVAAAPEARYIDGVSDGLRTAMRADPRVLLIGQDIAEYGGVFKVTEGFRDEFGAARVRNTPIIESGALGAALGLALDGFVPVVEMQFGDFIACGFNQIVNNIAKTHWRWGAAVPLVIRAPIGGGTGAGPFHSQSIEAWFTHVAGMKVVAPATPSDAKGLLLAAVRDGNPVLYLEHKLLYRSLKGGLPPDDFSVPIGRARVARAGADATVVAWSAAVGWALEAAESLAKDGRAVEVVDLRSLLPWDRALVLESVKKTGRALVLHEAPLTGGFGAEIAAVIGAEAFSWLDAPVARVGGLDTPVPFSRALEQVWLPAARLKAELEALLAW